jgi:hypothetical protein
VETCGSQYKIARRTENLFAGGRPPLAHELIGEQNLHTACFAAAI